MANANGWGDGASNNDIGWGQGANNSIGWGNSQLTSWSGSTDIDGGNAPSNSVAPAITGTAQEGQTLTCSTGTWSGSPTYTYQWKRNGNNIGGATSSTYLVALADVGQNILCAVTATNFVGSATANSNTVVPMTSIVTTGLAMNLDAGNSASYPGTGTTWTDLTGNSRTGTLINGVGYSSLNGGSLTFDGTNDYVSVANTTAVLSNVNKFTVDTWFKVTNPSSTTAYQTIFSFGTGTIYTTDILILINSGQVFAQVNNSSDGSGKFNFTSTAWTNFQMVYDGTLSGNANRLKLYLNGVLQTLTFDYTVPATSGTTSTCGIGAYSTGGFNNFLTGNVAVTRLYTTALSQTDVTQNFNAIKSRYGL